jgi:hypothetical protein
VLTGIAVGHLGPGSGDSRHRVEATGSHADGDEFGGEAQRGRLEDGTDLSDEAGLSQRAKARDDVGLGEAEAIPERAERPFSKGDGDLGGREQGPVGGRERRYSLSQRAASAAW